MAGSYNHVVTDQGNLVSNERFVQMVENLGDAFETVEEMYGMIWMLASLVSPDPQAQAEWVEWAQDNYRVGLTIAKTANRKEQGGG
jgi:hypothetical protein